MAQSFSLGPLNAPAISDPSVQEEINRHTDDADATNRILRSIGRFGSDPSIVRFDVIPLPYGRGARYTSAGWTVRAVRLERPSGDLPTDPPSNPST
jgi:hypothetical protein